MKRSIVIHAEMMPVHQVENMLMRLTESSKTIKNEHESLCDLKIPLAHHFHHSKFHFRDLMKLPVRV